MFKKADGSKCYMVTERVGQGRGRISKLCTKNGHRSILSKVSLAAGTEGVNGRTHSWDWSMHNRLRVHRSTI